MYRETSRGLAREFHADVIVARSNRALLMGVVARQVSDAPLVWSVHDQITSEYLGPVRASVMRFIGARAASAFIANSHSTLWTVRTNGKPAHVAPPGLHLESSTAATRGWKAVDHCYGRTLAP